jgi:UDP-N-acetylglucosamine 2-epimerase (non-hydrolysing)
MKIAPIIHALQAAQAAGTALAYRLVHTGQHYDDKMSGSFFAQLNIPAPDANLEAGGGSQAEQTAQIMVRFEQELLANPTDLVLVVGDVTSTMACAIVAQKLHVKVAHVEAGIRSNDWRMPEEINRLVTDAITNYFFTTTRSAGAELERTGVNPEHIYFVGNTMIDTLLKNRSRFCKPDIWDQLGLKDQAYIVMTLHRPANVDEANQLNELLAEIIKNTNGLPLVFPVHPRTAKMLDNLGISHPDLHTIEPLGYLEFNYLVERAKAVITDSGGITEETTVMGVPCLTLRDNTERPETITEGTNELIGTQPAAIAPALQRLFAGAWKTGRIPERWDGQAAQRIISTLMTLSKQTLHTLLLLLAFSWATNSFAQKKQHASNSIQVSDKILNCYNPGNHSFYVFDDSTAYWRYSVRQQRWRKQALVVESNLKWAEIKRDYIAHATDAQHIYLIERGCGIVYQLLQDTLRRIDNSYAHKNQYGAAVLTYNHKVHYFGGYGYFRTKNLLTYFDPKTLEWFERVNTNFEVRPRSRQDAQHELIDNKLYIWGGYGRRGYRTEQMLDLWAFDFIKQRWQQMGSVNPFYTGLALHKNTQEVLPATWFASGERLVHVSTKENKIFTYRNPAFQNYIRINSAADQQHFLVCQRGSNEANFTAVVMPLAQLTNQQVPSEQYFYKRISIFNTFSLDAYLWISLALNLILLLLLFYIRRIHKTNWFKRRHPKLRRAEFSDLEWSCLQMLAQHKSIELSGLNDLFDEEALSYETLKKRRESFIKSLRTKIALLTALDVGDILPETKHPKDKRMKVINWTEQLDIKSDE